MQGSVGSSNHKHQVGPDMIQEDMQGPGKMTSSLKSLETVMEALVARTSSSWTSMESSEVRRPMIQSHSSLGLRAIASSYWKTTPK